MVHLTNWTNHLHSNYQIMDEMPLKVITTKLPMDFHIFFHYSQTWTTSIIQQYNCSAVGYCNSPNICILNQHRSALFICAACTQWNHQTQPKHIWKNFLFWKVLATVNCWTETRDHIALHITLTFMCSFATPVRWACEREAAQTSIYTAIKSCCHRA